MSRGEQSLRKQLQRAAQMEHGEAQQALLEKVVRHADSEQLPKLAFAARRSLANAYCVDRQWHKAFPLFARCLSEYDASPEQYGPEEDWRLRNWYANIAQSMAEFHDISLQQIYGAFTDMQQRFSAGGHNLRDVHAASRWVAQLACDWPEEERNYQLWLAAGGAQPGSVWDFEAEIERLVFRGDAASEAQALAMAEPVLDGRITFTEPSAPIQCLMLLPLARAGRHAEAAAAYRSSQRAMRENVYRFEYASMAAEFCALTGNKERGLAEVLSRLHGFPTLNRPNGRMEFATATAIVLQQFDPETEGREMIGYGIDEEPSITINQLRDDMTAAALDLASKFDARNGTTHQGDRIRAKLAQKPIVDFIALTPTALPGHQPPIPAGLSPAEMLDRAEWHCRGDEYEQAIDYLDALPAAPPPRENVRAQQLRALMIDTGSNEQTLRWAAEQHRQAGDARRYLLCLCDLAKLLTLDKNRGREAHELCAWTVAQLYATGDKWAMAWGEFRMAEVMVNIGKSGEYEPLQRGMTLAAELKDAHSNGIMGEVCSKWHDLDQNDPQVVLELAFNVKQMLLLSGATFKTLRLFDTIKSAFYRAGNPAGFVNFVRTQLDELPPSAPDGVAGALRYERGMATLDAGDPAAALPDLTEGVAQAQRHAYVRADHWFFLAKAAYLAEDVDQAVEAAENASEWTADWRDRGMLVHPEMADQAQLILARCYRALELPEATFTAYDQLVKQAKKFKSEAVLAEGLADSGELLALNGDVQEGLSRIDQAATLQRALGNEQAAQHYQAASAQLRAHAQR